ncbi:MAG TPA: c-type cytochrome [Bryobacteraceae bacterium]|nr:c-type cytochrome [Bryobacteraceae bacterium]
MRRIVVLGIALGIAGTAFGQRGPRAMPDPGIDLGGRLYATNCFHCHGDGNQVAGVDFRKGQFKRASTDADLAGVIRAGVPGTAMPAHPFSAYEMTSLVAYLRSLHSRPEMTAGDTAAGRAVFEGKGGCQSCHRVNGKGSRVALDLSDIGTMRSAAYLERALADPTAVLVPQNRFIRAVTREGATITGRRLNEDTESVQLIDEHEKLVSLQKADLRSYTVLTNSTMPSYRDKLTAKERTDLVAYLVSLKGSGAR